MNLFHWLSFKETASTEILKTIIPEQELFPIKDTPAWRIHHAFGAWGDERWLCKTVMERYFGPAGSLEELVAQSDWLQSEGYRGAFEEMRRQWPRCSMAINWCYNEPWKTAAGNNIIAYPAIARPSYYYVQKALRPTLFSAKVAKFGWRSGETFEAEIWLLNDTPTTVGGKVKVSAKVGDNEFALIEWQATASPNANMRGVTVRFVLPEAPEADRITLTLDAGSEYSSIYEYSYRPTKRAKSGPRQLNI